MELCMILFSTVDKLTALTKWPVLPFICNFSENECNKFNCWDFKLSNNVNTVHVAAILRKLQQQEKVFECLCTPPKRDLLPRWHQVSGGRATRGGGHQEGGGCSLQAFKKYLNMLPKMHDISVFSSHWQVFKYFWSKCMQLLRTYAITISWYACMWMSDFCASTLSCEMWLSMVSTQGQSHSDVVRINANVNNDVHVI